MRHQYQTITTVLNPQLTGLRDTYYVCSSEYRITEVRGGSSYVVEVRNIFAQKATARVQKGGHGARYFVGAGALRVLVGARAARSWAASGPSRPLFRARRFRGGADGDGRSLGEVLTE